jgi:hypothetical protein
MKKQIGFVLAAAVGALFATSAFAAADTNAQAADQGVKCTGANACKGQSACKTGTNACKGQNNCKGTGMIMTATEKECTDKGGKVEKGE